MIDASQSEKAEGTPVGGRDQDWAADASREVWGGDKHDVVVMAPEKQDKAERASEKKDPVGKDVIHIQSQEQFKDIVENTKGPILIKFGTEWCAPCRAMKGTLNDLANNFKGRATVLSIDINQDPSRYAVQNSWAYAQKNPWDPNGFNLGGIPRLMMFNNGKIVDKEVNTRDPRQLSDRLNAEISKAADKKPDRTDPGKDHEKDPGKDHTKDPGKDHTQDPGKDQTKHPGKDGLLDKKNSFDLNDGTYKLDDKGRLCETISKDQPAFKRSLKYEDRDDPRKVTGVVMNDKTEYERIKGSNNWNTYDVSGGSRKPMGTGTAAFDITTSPSGVVGIDYLKGAGIQYRGTAGTTDLTQDQIKEREALAKQRIDDLVPPNKKPGSDTPIKTTDFAGKIEDTVQKAQKDGKPVVFVYTGGGAPGGNGKADREAVSKLAESMQQNSKPGKQPSIVFVSDDDLKAEKAKSPEARTKIVDDLLKSFDENHLDRSKPQVIIERLSTGPKGIGLSGGVMYRNPLDWVQEKPEQSSERMKVLGQGIAGEIEKYNRKEAVHPPEPETIKPIGTAPDKPAPDKAAPDKAAADKAAADKAAADKAAADKAAADKAAADKAAADNAKPKTFDLPVGNYKLDGEGKVETRSKDGLLKRILLHDKGNVSKYVSEYQGQQTVFERTGDHKFKQYVVGKDGTVGPEKEWLGDMKFVRGVFEFSIKGEADPSGKPIFHKRGPGDKDLNEVEARAVQTEFVKKADATSKIDGDKEKDKASDKESDKIKDKEKDARPLDNQPFDGTQVKLPDGTYKRDEEGRITETLSADGGTKHVFKYGNAKFPNRITSDMVNDTTEYRYLGRVTIGYDNKPYEKEGFEVNSYSTYSKDGQLTGNWAGIRSVSPNGVLSVLDDHTNGPISHLDASGNKLDENQRKSKETDGIWPSQFEIKMDDGTNFLAKLKGTKLDSLTETKADADGKPKEIVWSKNGDKWRSDATPPIERRQMELHTDGTLRYEDLDNIKHVVRKDGSSDAIVNGVTRTYDKEHVLRKITQQNGDSRTLGYSDKGKDLISITDATHAGTKKCDREAGSDTWKVGDKTEVRKDLKVKEDGGIEYKLENNNKLERPDFTSVLRDKDGSPLEMTNQRGDTRTFKWNGEGANKTVGEITDTKKTAKGDVSETWARKGDSDDFASTNSKGKERIRQGVRLSPEANGDYTYKSANGAKEIVARLGSDAGSALSQSVEEAHENLLDEMRDKLPEANFKRLQEMTQNFEKRMEDRGYLRKLAGVKGAESIEDEIQKEVQGTYDAVREMVNKGDEGTFYDQKTRVKLAENFLYHAMEPTTIDQGPASNGDWNGHGTCWIQSGQIWGMTQHPAAMADYLKQVCLNGEVTLKNGGEGNPDPKTYTFSSRLLSFDGQKQESKWTIGSSTQEWRDEGSYKFQIIGDRSPVSKIFDFTLPILSGARREGDVDGGMYETLNLVGRGNTRGVRDILYMVTGDVPVDKGQNGYSSGHLLNNNFRQSMAEKGTVLTYAPGHLRSQTVRKVDNDWYLIQDDQHGENNDKVLAKITDIEKWVAGDRNVEQPVKISALELLHKKQYTGSGDADRLGAVTPRKGASAAPAHNPPPRQQGYRQGYQQGQQLGQQQGQQQAYLPQVEFVYR